MSIFGLFRSRLWNLYFAIKEIAELQIANKDVTIAIVSIKL
ncbi:hypothetical protein BFG60_2811 [Microcystis aeruginosa NIES-98]|nr:hypothetical protein BFG60_2811 [Microcystis aeruginosa NIES-98]